MTTMTSKRTFIWITISVAAVLVLGAVLGYVLSAKGMIGQDKAPEYSAVYLTTGDIYFGEFSRFPKPHMENVLYLQRGILDEEDQEQTALSAFQDVAWSPEGRIYLSLEQIVWIAPIRDDSPLMQAFDSL